MKREIIYRTDAMAAIGNLKGLSDTDKSKAMQAILDVPAEESTDSVKSHSEKQILEGCIALIDEMVGYFREYLDFIDFTPEYDEEKQPFCMSYFHIVNRLFLWDTSHCGGTSTRAKCHELGIDDSSKTVKFELWEDEEEDGEEEQHGSD